MKNNSNKIIGLIGGMGPYASAYFYEMLLQKSNKLYGVKNNDEYPEIVIDSVPVPDFISEVSKLEQAKDMLIVRTKKLNDFGCSVIAMVCNTGHILYKDLAQHSNAPFLSMIDLVSEETNKRNFKKVGVLATSTTINTGLYDKVLSSKGITVMYPSVDMQQYHEIVIRDVIAGENADKHKQDLFTKTKDFVENNQLDGIILGCTELPLIFPKDKFTNVIDCLEVLADELLERYYN